MTRIVYILTAFVYLGCVCCQKYVSDAELKTWSEELLLQDTNNVGKYVSLSLQGKSKSNSTDDNAPLPLMVVDKKAFQGPTVSLLFALYNNFEPDTNIVEKVTNEEIGEQHRFMNAVMRSPVFSYAKQLLRSKDLIPKIDRELDDYMYKLWFKLYPRSRRKLSSSAFEHIFLGEIKNNQIAGFHNWLFYNYLESQHKLNYLGWVKHIEIPNQKGSILKFRFSWGNMYKPVGSMFIGTSPELELSLYTICFVARPNNKCNLSFGGKPFQIQTFTFTHDNDKTIGSAYPSL